MKSFKNQIVLITGGGNGIGKEMAIQFALQDAHVIILDWIKDDLDETTSEISSMGKECTGFHCDICNQSELTGISEIIKEKFGHINILINNAGMSLGWKNFEDISNDHWDRIFKVNFFGALNCAKIFLSLFENDKSSCMVNICSVYGLVAIARRSAYCASKFALRGLSEALSIELKPRGIKVVTVYPGAVRTSITRHSKGWNDPEEKIIAEKAQTDSRATSIKTAVKEIIHGLIKGKSNILVGKDAKILDFLRRIYPFSLNHLLNSIISNIEARSKKRYKKENQNISFNRVFVSNPHISQLISQRFFAKIKS